VALLFLAVALLACWLPARRAARVTDGGAQNRMTFTP